MKLLLATTVPHTLKHFLTPFARHFRGQGWQVDCMAHDASSWFRRGEEFDRVWDIAWSRNPLDPANLRIATRQVRAVVEEAGYDIVHVHTPVAAFVTRLALRGMRKRGSPRVIYTAHGFHFHRGGNPAKNLAFLSLERLAARWTDLLVVINPEDEAAARRRHLLPPDRIRYIPGIGVDTRALRPDRFTQNEIREVRRELGLSERDVLFTMVAGIEPVKRHRDAIRAFAHLNHESAHLALAGTGVLFEAMQALASELRVAGRVHFLGFVGNTAPLMLASTATLLPSEREGLSRSVMESLCLGVPVIGTHARGVRDLLCDGSGRLVEVGDIPALSRAMRWVIENRGEARRMGDRGRAKMAAYDIRNILKLHEELYGGSPAETEGTYAQAVG